MRRSKVEGQRGGGKLRARLATLAAGLCVFGWLAQPVGARADLASAWNEFTTFYRALVSEHQVVGSSVMLIHDGTVVASTTDGFQDLATRRPVDQDTIFHWASITKTFTGIAIMQLRDRGLLRLDDPVVSYVPELRQVHDPFGDMSAITLRHLMTHSGGFRNGTWPWGGDQPWHPFEPPGWEQLVAMLPYTEILFEPGSRYSYSNPGIIFLGRTIELLADEPFEAYIDKHILKPLEMYRSYFDTTPPHLLPHRSHSYLHTETGLGEARFDFNTGITVSNGGLNAPLPDMAKYVDFLAGNPSRQKVHDLVLRRASLEEMFQPQIARPASGTEGLVNEQSGLIFFLERYEGHDLIGHTGSQNGFVSNLWLHLPSRTGVIVACNTPDGLKDDGHLVDRMIRDYVVGRLFPLIESAGAPQPRCQ